MSTVSNKLQVLKVCFVFGGEIILFFEEDRQAFIQTEVIEVPPFLWFFCLFLKNTLTHFVCSICTVQA